MTHYLVEIILCEQWGIGLPVSRELCSGFCSKQRQPQTAELKAFKVLADATNWRCNFAGFVRDDVTPQFRQLDELCTASVQHAFNPF